MSKFLNAAKAIAIDMLKRAVEHYLVQYGPFLVCLILVGLVLVTEALGLPLDLTFAVPIAVLVLFVVVRIRKSLDWSQPPENPVQQPVEPDHDQDLRWKSKKPGD
jgi:flagellar biosynthesis component FlhA